MREEGCYRFSLKFAADTEERIRVGEMLERLGNRKSTVVVAALFEYLVAHPEMEVPSGKVEVKLSTAITREELEQMIRPIVEERFAEMKQYGLSEGKSERSPTVSDDALEQMLGNLDIFM